MLLHFLDSRKFTENKSTSLCSRLERTKFQVVKKMQVSYKVITHNLQKDAYSLIYLCSFRDEFDDVFSHAWSAGLFSQYELSFIELKGPSC